MYSLNYEQHVEAWSPDEFRSYLDSHHPESYQLVDVRQQDEFSRKHLPGALSLPADDLIQQLQPLNKQKTTLVYCGQGALSQTAAAVLARAGFERVCFLCGGLDAWQHGTSSGLPQNLCAPLLSLEDAAEQAVLAWQIEDAARTFYLEISKNADNSEVANLFAELATEEGQHQTTLKILWEALKGELSADNFPGNRTTAEPIMEGGLSLDEALAWAVDKPLAKIIDYAMAMELNAYDQYLYLQRYAKDPNSQRLFEVMADEERHHLKLLAQSLGKLGYKG